MRLRSAADSFAFRAAAAFLAIAERSALVKELARAFPPNLPRATAFGFFVDPMHRIISLSDKLVKRELLCSSLFPPLGQPGASPLEADVSA